MRSSFLVLPILLVAACSGDDSGGSASTTTPSPALIAEVDLTTQTDSAYAVDWSADGATLAVSAGVELILLYSDLTEISTVTPSGGAIGAAVIADGLKYATVGGVRNSTITVWDWNAETQLTLAREVETGADQFAVSWSPDERLVASLAGDRDSTIQVWEASTWNLLGEYDLPYTNSRRALNWSADSTLIYDAGEIDGEVGYFSIDAQDGTVTELGRLPLEQVVAAAVDADGSRIAVADATGMVRIFDVASGAALAEFQSVADPVDLAWNEPDGTLAILSYNTALQLWSVS
ncbi:MAG: hypothetical protein K8R99_12865 [Actinomycetia bacterium]|nr:hypothetical protein [Actinomycetes bacterium]